MTVQELTKKLEEFPPDREVVIFDTRMNCHNADGEGTSAGIYEGFNLATTILSKYNEDGVIDEDSETYHVLAFNIKNDTDYDEDCNRIEY